MHRYMNIHKGHVTCLFSLIIFSVQVASISLILVSIQNESLVCIKIIAQVQTHLKIKLLVLTIAIGQATDTLQNICPINCP